MSFPLKKILILENLKNEVNYGYNLWKFNRLMGITSDRSQFYRLLREMKQDALIIEVEPDPEQPSTNRKTTWYSVTAKGLEYIDDALRTLVGNFIYLTLFDQIDTMEQLVSLIENSGAKTLVNYIHKFHRFRDVPHLSMFSAALQKTNVTAMVISNSDFPPDLAEMVPKFQILPNTLQPVSHSIGIILCMDLFFVPIEDLEDLIKRFDLYLDTEKGFLLCALPIVKPENIMFSRFDRILDLINRDLQPVKSKAWIDERIKIIQKHLPHSNSLQIRQLQLIIFSKNEVLIHQIEKPQNR
jgi:DNA-binding PadR family transcriptional regulator